MGKTIARDAVFPKLLRVQKYRCARCGVKQNSWVYKTASGSYTELDEFEKEHSEAAGFKVFKMHLRLAFVDGVSANFQFYNLLALCPQCTQTHRKDLKLVARREVMGDLNGLEIHQIEIIKNFFQNELSIKIDTRNVLRVTSLISNILKNGNEKQHSTNR